METPYHPKTILDMFQETCRRHPDTPAQMSRVKDGEFQSRTFAELKEEASLYAAGLSDLGLRSGEPVGLIADNRKEWLVADLGILALGACDVPRGRDTMAQELVYILGIPRCRLVVAENAEQADKILSVRENLASLEHLLLLDPETTEDQIKAPAGKIRIHTYGEIIDSGRKKLAQDPGFWDRETAQVEPSSLATIIFTSGTTGEPKGVMLTHSNFCHQLKEVHKVIDIKPGDRWLSILPVWHVFERVAQYIALYTSSTLAYSKPIGKILLQDFLAVRPMWMASVPRIWEALKAGIEKNARDQGPVTAGLFAFFTAVGKISAVLASKALGRFPRTVGHFRPWEALWPWVPYLLLSPLRMLGDLLVFSKVKAKMGGRFRAGISGGGTLPEEVDLFFAAAGITLLNGYGLTETAPVIAIRNYFRPVLYTLHPLPDTEIRIVDDQGRDCRPGEKGLIKVRGGQVMKGYFENPQATAKVLDADGWFNTGDLGVWTTSGDFQIRGRAKDTIVLSGGENVEPGPIENKLRESTFISQAMVVGQDRKYLSVLIQPNADAVEAYLNQNDIPYVDREQMVELPEVQELFNEEIAFRINGKNGFRPFERLVRFTLIRKPFEVGAELSAKQEVKRHVISELYSREISAMYKG